MGQQAFSFDPAPSFLSDIADMGEEIAPAATAAVSLWPHQRKQYIAVKAELAKEDVRSTLVVSATGTGKTTMLSSVVKTWPGRALVIAHRDEIITQLQERLQLVTGEVVDREQAGFRASFARICVASIQTISRESRISRFAQDHFSLLVVDEAHHAIATSYRAVLDYFKTAKVLGVTATPDRGDRLALGEEFDSVANVYDIADAIKDGILCPFVRQRVIVDDLDLSSVSTTAGDLNQGELDEAMGESHALEGVAKPTFELAGSRQTVVFTTSVANAHLLAGLFNELRPNCARAVDGGMDIESRRELLRAYARGDFQFLCNVMIASEGWDDPPTSCVAIGRPTKSRALMAQFVGRGLRIHPGKQDCLILEFTDKTERHDLASPLDVLAGKYTDEEISLAKELGDKKPGQRVDVLLEAAREEIKRRVARKVTYSVRAVDPFAVYHMDAGDDLEWQFGKKPPSEKQLAALRKFGVDFAADISKQQASKLLGTVFKRRSLNLASFKQLKTLGKYGITDINLSFPTASRVIDAIAKNGWRGLSPTQYQAALQRETGSEG